MLILLNNKCSFKFYLNSVILININYSNNKYHLKSFSKTLISKLNTNKAYIYNLIYKLI